MLPRSHRLTRSTDFQRAVRRGRRASSKTLVVHALAQPDAETSQVGFVVSKAVGNAVTRNTVKRRLRNATRDRLGDLGEQLIVIRALPAAADADFHRLASDLERCLHKVKDGTT